MTAGMAPPFTALKPGCPVLLVFCARGRGSSLASRLAYLRIHANLLRATRCSVGFNLDRASFPRDQPALHQVALLAFKLRIDCCVRNKTEANVANVV